MNLIGDITSLFGGGLTGIIGSVVSSVYAYKSKQLDIELQKEKYANEVELKKADAAIMAQEWTARTQIAATTAEAQMDSEASKAFAASLSSEPQRYAEGSLTPRQTWLMVLLDFARGIIRPGLTLYLVVITTLIYFQARSLMGAGMSAEQAVDLLSLIVKTVLYLTSTTVLWWFGTRFKKEK